jgi:rhamnulokinase
MTAATADFLAVDLGASGGRVILGRWDGTCFELEELHRFPNGPVEVLGRLHWDHLRLWAEIKAGLARYVQRYGGTPAAIGLDTWGVDYALLDRAGNLLGNPYHYRDSGNNGMLEAAFQRVSRREIYGVTGIQFMQINTLYQLLSRVLARDPQLDQAATLLMTPDLFHYWLTGRQAGEYTIASTSQMLDARSRTWATELLGRLGVPGHFLPALVEPGSVLGDVRGDVAAEVGFGRPVPVIATGSHDTANAVAAVPELDGESVYVSSGTWSLMGMELPEPLIDDRTLALDFTNEGGVARTIRLLKNMTGLWLLQECRRQWQREGRLYGWDELVALAQEAEPFRSLINPDEPEFGAPGDMPAAIRAYCRRTGQPEPDSVARVVRCCLESLALKSRWLLECLESLMGRRLEVIRIVGGGTQNRLLSQFTADACERPVVTGPVEATAMGNLVLQAMATGHLAGLAQGRQAVGASVRRERFEAQPGDAWQEAYGRAQQLF